VPPIADTQRDTSILSGDWHRDALHAGLMALRPLGPSPSIAGVHAALARIAEQVNEVRELEKKLCIAPVIFSETSALRTRESFEVAVPDFTDSSWFVSGTKPISIAASADGTYLLRNRGALHFFTKDSAGAWSERVIDKTQGTQPPINPDAELVRPHPAGGFIVTPPNVGNVNEPGVLLRLFLTIDKGWQTEKVSAIRGFRGPFSHDILANGDIVMSGDEESLIFKQRASDGWWRIVAEVTDVGDVALVRNAGDGRCIVAGPRDGIRIMFRTAEGWRKEVVTPRFNHGSKLYPLPDGSIAEIRPLNHRVITFFAVDRSGTWAVRERAELPWIRDIQSLQPLLKGQLLVATPSEVLVVRRDSSGSWRTRSLAHRNSTISGAQVLNDGKVLLCGYSEGRGTQRTAAHSFREPCRVWAEVLELEDEGP